MNNLSERNNLLINVILVIIFCLYLPFGLLKNFDINHWGILVLYPVLVFSIFSSFVIPFYSLIPKSFKFRLSTSFTFSIVLLATINRILLHLEMASKRNNALVIFCGIVISLMVLFQKKDEFRASLKFPHLKKLQVELVLGVIALSFLLLNSLFRPGAPLGVLFPPFDCDLSLIHYSLVKVFAEKEALINTWWLRLPFIPQFQHSLFLIIAQSFKVLNLRSDIAPGLVNVVGFLLTGTIIKDLFKSSTRAIWYLVIMLIFPVVRWNVGSSYLDVLNTYFCTFSIVLLYEYIKEKRVEFLALSVTMSLFAFVTKYYAGVVLAPVYLIAFLYCFWKRRDYLPHFKVKKMAGLALIGAVVASVFLYQNYKLSGNPIFPFFSKLNTPNEYLWDKESSRSMNWAIGHWKLDSGIGSILSVYKKIVVEPERFQDTPGYPLGLFWIIFYFTTLIIGVCLFVIKKRKEGAIFIGLCAVSTFYSWLYSSPVYRYLQPQISVLVIFFILVIDNLESRILKKTFIGILFVCGFFLRGNLSFSALETFPITENEINQYKNKFGYGHKVESYISNNTKEGDVVLNLFTGCYGLYMTRPTIGDWFGPDAFSNFANKNSTELKLEYSKRDVSYVVFDYGAENIKQAYGSFEKINGEYFDCFKYLISLDGFSVYKLDRTKNKCFDKKLVEKRIDYLKSCSARESEIFK